MDKFKVILLPNARKFYENCPLDLAKCLNTCFENLEENPFFGPNIKLLKTQKGIKLYRYKLGDHRVIYEINKGSKKVGILYISPRPVAYRRF